MKLNNIFFLMVVLFLAASCEDVLDVKPTASVSPDEAFSTIENFNYATDGLYSQFRDINSSGLANSFVLYPDILSDNCSMNFVGRKSFQNLYTWTYNKNDGAVDVLWSAGYSVIHSANMILEKIDGFKGGKLEERDRIKGEALAMRALVHYQLVRYFGKPFQSANSTDLGVPYLTSSTVNFPARNTVNECYEKIIKDFTDAETLLSKEGVDRKLTIAFSADAVRALLANVYLTQRNFTKAIQYSTLLINKYTLVSAADFSKLWTVDNFGTEVIFKIRCLEKEGQRIGNLYTVATSSEYVPSYEFFQKFTNNDVRRSAYFMQYTMGLNSKTYNFIIKYAQRNVADGLGLSDIIISRVAEQYLIRAEAYSESVNDVDALSDLNALRRNRYTGFVDGSETGNALKDAIALERRLELAFEGHRWFDLQRKGIDISRSPIYGDFADGTGTITPQTSLPFSDYRRIFPIPFAETNYNTNSVQNDDY